MIKCAPCLAIELAELAVWRLDLSRIDFGMVGEDVLPPLHLVYFYEEDEDGLLIL